MPPTPFLIGIDLGTTNSAVAAVDTRKRNPRVEVFRIPQLTAPGVVEPWPVLPSFLYFPEADEIAAGGIALPWAPKPTPNVGVLARDRGALAPARHVDSAKSWLAHPGVDRHAAFLPWGGTGAAPRISPLDASARYLMHVRDAWNATIASADEAAAFERQTIVLTVPASFDEEARELTIEAAQAAQLSRTTLLEEPIAAFYAWMAEQRKAIALEDDEIALVCDVGGGTTDFSLIRVRIEAAAASFERVAIGDHLLLGGDNLDLALAAVVAPPTVQRGQGTDARRGAGRPRGDHRPGRRPVAHRRFDDRRSDAR
jgi:molecular chaperone DnaK (HSP70)